MKRNHAVVAKTESWNIMLKRVVGGGGERTGTMFVSSTTQVYPHSIVPDSANAGSKSCIFGIPPGKVAIGSAGGLGGWTKLTRGSGLLIE